MLSLITDLKNFAMGTVSGPLNKAANWGTRAMFGLILPAPIIGLAGAPAVALGFYVCGMGAAIAGGAAYGVVTGGVREVVHRRYLYEHHEEIEKSNARSYGGHGLDQGKSSTHFRDHVQSDELSRMLQVQGIER